MSTSLPLLREDLKLYPGPEHSNGEPTWSIHDPVRNRYFRIEHSTFILLSLWHSETEETLLNAVYKQSCIRIDKEQLQVIIRFLQLNQLLVSDSAESITGLIQQNKAGESHWFKKMVHGYLFFRIPLVRPDRFLEGLTSLCQPLFSMKWLMALFAVGVSGLMLGLRQWDSFTTTASGFMTPSGIAAFFIALVVIKVIHELGHGVAAKYYGCRVPTMGVAFLVMFPVLYTDTTDAWQLTSYRQRMIIGAAGMVAELSIACFATLLWSFLPDGVLRSTVFMLATVTWMTSLLVNLNPLMRFDGYYLLSDAWKVENLQQRSFELATWKIREWLFNLSQPMPELWDQKQIRKLLVYAFCTWIYRFFLFLGIALLVYHFFFKVLGLILFLVEIIWFIGLPVYKEIQHWWKQKGLIMKSRRVLVTALLFMMVGVALFIPFDTTLELPAVMTAQQQVLIYPPYSGGKIDSVRAIEGRQVKQGETLFVLSNPDLEQKKRLIKMRMNLLNTLLNRSAADREHQQSTPVYQQQLASCRTELQGIDNELELLTIKAPFAGRVTFLDHFLGTGLWVNAKRPLLRLVNEQGVRVEAYVDATDLNRITRNSEGRFYPDDITVLPFSLIVHEVSPASNNLLDKPYLSADYGGPIAVRQNPQGQSVPEKGLYKVKLILPNAGRSSRVQTGVVNLDAPDRSFADYIREHVWAVFIRESGV